MQSLKNNTFSTDPFHSHALFSWCSQVFCFTLLLKMQMLSWFWLTAAHLTHCVCICPSLNTRKMCNLHASLFMDDNRAGLLNMPPPPSCSPSTPQVYLCWTLASHVKICPLFAATLLFSESALIAPVVLIMEFINMPKGCFFLPAMKKNRIK